MVKKRRLKKEILRMKFQFTTQQYQTDTVDADVKVFPGQPKHDGMSYRIDPRRVERGKSFITSS